jgi:hypothetical protein
MPIEFRRSKRVISFADARDLLGLTTLHGDGNKSTYWITVEDIQFGVHAVQSIGEIYALLNPHYNFSIPREYPLFPTLYSQKHRYKNNRNVKTKAALVSNFADAPTRTPENFNAYRQ